MEPILCHCTKARRAARRLTAVYDRALAPVGLKVTQFSLLRAIGRREGATISDVAAATGLDRSTLGRNLRPLAKAGLVALGAGQDERARAVALTPAGWDAVDRAVPHWQRAQASVETCLEPAELALLDGIVERLDECRGSSDARS